MDLEHVALTWCVRFAGQINSHTVKGAVGFGAFQRAFPRQRGELTSQHQEDPYHRRVFSKTFFAGIKGSEEFIERTLSFV